MPANLRPRPSRSWHTLGIPETIAASGSSPQGLSSEEAAKRLAEHGPNEFGEHKGPSAWSVLADQFRNVLIWILLIAGGLSLMLGETIESAAIGVIVVLSVALGFVQEFRAEKALEALRDMSAPHAHVMRDGEEVDLAAKDLVSGDVILLRAGDRVPADARLIEAVNLRAEEAPLTGESVPVDKQADVTVPEDASVGDRHNLVFSGTNVVNGRGRGVVIGTAHDTEFGKIAHLLQSVEETRTPMQIHLDKIGRMLARSALAVVALIVVAGLLRGQPWAEVLIFGIALAVAVVPEALPAVVTISLAIGVQRMARRHALIRKLPAVETLGSATVICSDKTGTMTRDEMTARRVVTLDDALEITGGGYDPVGTFTKDGTEIKPSDEVVHLLRGGQLASDAQIAFDEESKRWTVHGDPTEGAIVVAAIKAGIDIKALQDEFPRRDEIPFSSETKRMTTLHQGSDGMRVYVKGAAEMILKDCSLAASHGNTAALDDATRVRFTKAADDLASLGLRVLAIAFKKTDALANSQNGLTLLGLVGLMDPPRAEVKEAIKVCKEAGINVIMITGDHPVTAMAIGTELGLTENRRLVAGSEVEAMSDEALQELAPDVSIFARVSPAHKLRIVQALQRRGHVVVMTGDGVNDAPALKRADMGVAMGISGTDVSREAAAMTLTDDNFTSIVAAVEEGRGIYDNIRKYLSYLLSSNVGEIILLGGAAFAGLPLPLTTVQILYVNLATDGLPALALALDPPSDDVMKRKPRPPRASPFDRDTVTLIVGGGLWSALVNIALFLWALSAGLGLQKAQTMAFVSLVLIQFLKAYNFRTGLLSMFHHMFANRWLNMAIIWELALLAVIIYWRAMHGPFGTVSLSLKEWLIVLLLAFSICPVLEVLKVWLRRRNRFAS
jgi:Ca2+-transporting ATPase